jgi:hypothetical protein
VYLSFMPLDLTEMVVSWESRNLFKWNGNRFLLKKELWMQWNSCLRPEMYENGRNQRWGNTTSWSRSTTRAGLQIPFDTMFDSIGIPVEVDHLHNHSHNQIKHQHTNAFAY